MPGCARAPGGHDDWLTKASSVECRAWCRHRGGREGFEAAGSSPGRMGVSGVQRIEAVQTTARVLRREGPSFWRLRTVSVDVRSMTWHTSGVTIRLDLGLLTVPA